MKTVTTFLTFAACSSAALADTMGNPVETASDYNGPGSILVALFVVGLLWWLSNK